MSSRFLKERLTVWRRIGIVLIIAGAVMVAGLGPGDFGGRESIGQAILLSATLLWAAYTVALRKARLDGLHATAIACVASLIVYIPIYLALFVAAPAIEPGCIGIRFQSCTPHLGNAA
jgi:drug/metabolite transporter (DMT)-like permease